MHSLWHSIMRILVAGMSGLLICCAQGPAGVDLRTRDRVAMNVSVQTKSTGYSSTNVDEEVRTIRVIVFTAGGDTQVYNQVKPAQPGTVSDYVVKVEAVTGLVDFYVICNESAELGQQLALVQSPEQLKTLMKVRSAQLPLTMFAEVKNVQIDKIKGGSEGSPNTTVHVGSETYTGVLPVAVTRLGCKLSLTVIKHNHTFSVESVSVKVRHVPKYSYFGVLPYNETSWADDILLGGGVGRLDNDGDYVVSENNYTIPDGVDRLVFDDLYLPEHLLSDKTDVTQATYLMVTATCAVNGGGRVLATYVVNLGQDPPRDHSLYRNTQYKMYATIRHIGAAGLYADIVPVSMHNVLVNWKPLDGLVVVSDRAVDFDSLSDRSKNVDVWTDYTSFSGILKSYNVKNGFSDVVFKYGSLVAVKNDISSSVFLPFVLPTSQSDWGDVLWYPQLFDLLSIDSWDKIPYVASGETPLDNTSIALGVGDPCKLAGLSHDQIAVQGIKDNKQWHMATAADYDLLVRMNHGLTSDYGYSAHGVLLLPNTKVRSTTGTLSAAHDRRGVYWVSDQGKAFTFTAPSTGASIAAADRRAGYTVRCVRNEIDKSVLNYSNIMTYTYTGAPMGSPMGITSNMPHWTLTLDKDPANYASTISAQEREKIFNAFSFTAGGTTVHRTTGSYSQSIPLFIGRNESLTERRFYLILTGYGFDGEVLTHKFSLLQYGYTLYADMKFTPAIVGKIPKAGETYSIALSLTPSDVPIPVGYKLVIEARYNTNLRGKGVATQLTTIHGYDYTVPITIGPNTSPDIIGINFSVSLVDAASETSSHSLSTDPIESNQLQSN